MGAAQDSHPQPDSPAPAQPSFTQKWEASNIVEHAGSNQFSVQIGCDNAPEYSRLPAVAYGRTKREAKERAALVAASPSLYAYAKAETLFFAWMRAIGEDEGDAAQKAYVEYITSVGWDGKPDPGGYLNTLRATALALAEGGNNV